MQSGNGRQIRIKRMEAYSLSFTSYIYSVVVVQFLGKYIILVMGGSTYEVVEVVTRV